MDPSGLTEIKLEMRRGDYLAAYDEACRRLTTDAADPGLRYYAVLALARAGATTPAVAEYRARRPHLIRQEDVGHALWTDCRSLWPRIVKDMALAAAPSERPRLLRRAARAYRQAYAETGSAYPGINAATLLALSGAAAEAETLARDLLQLPELLDPDRLAAAGDYWPLATRAEALVILRRWDEAARSLELFRTLAGPHHGSVATARRQLSGLLRTIPAEPDTAARLLSLLRVPRVALCVGADVSPEEEGLLAREVAAVIATDEIGTGIGTLWSTGALVMAEQILAGGAELHLVLPFSAEDYRTYVRTRCPAAEIERRERCLMAATSITEATADGDHPDPHLIGYASSIAAGLAQTRSRHLSTDCIRIEHDAASRGGRTTASRAVPALHVRIVGIGRGQPASRPPPVQNSPPRELCAFLYGDVEGFSKIAESRLPAFLRDFMGEVAGAIERHASAILYRNTWGDAVFLVLSDIAAAAELALAIQERAAFLRREGGWKETLRIALHHGPVFRGWDPVRKAPSYFGTQVSRVARLEPVVMSGAVYVTEPFAAILATEASDRFEAEYVGKRQLAKNYGEHRIYRLTRRLAES